MTLYYTDCKRGLMKNLTRNARQTFNPVLQPNIRSKHLNQIGLLQYCWVVSLLRHTPLLEGHHLLFQRLRITLAIKRGTFQNKRGEERRVDMSEKGRNAARVDGYKGQWFLQILQVPTCLSPRSQAARMLFFKAPPDSTHHRRRLKENQTASPAAVGHLLFTCLFFSGSSFPRGSGGQRTKA